MPILNWIGKDKIVNHDKDLPFRVLKPNEELSEGNSDNLLVRGDNLEGLKALLPFYAGKVKCVYIDPPYNTGNQTWKYNDRVDAPQIREWLNKVVGTEGQDLCRHDKWLCMMYPRLKLLRELMKDDGVIFISIDDIELSNLESILDEIFGAANKVGIIVWKNATDNNPTNIANEHEYIVCYAKNRQKIPTEWKSSNLAVKDTLLKVGEQLATEYAAQEDLQTAYTKWFRANKATLWPFDRYKLIDDQGVYTGSQSVHNPGKEGYRYDIVHPITGKPCVQPLMGYRFPEDTAKRLIEEGRIIFGKDENKIIELKVYAKDYRSKLPSLFELDGRTGTNEIKKIFPENKRPFDFPKPSALLEELISFTTSGDDIVLDSFAGSGTTGHAVLNLNKADGGSRKFILIELEDHIAEDITAERLRRVVKGYKGARYEDGTGGGFSFLRLNGELFNKDGIINSEAKYDDLASYVYYTETNRYLELNKINQPLLSKTNGVSYYLLFKDINSNILDDKVFEDIKNVSGTKIVYADKCLIDQDTCDKYSIVFKQIPYELRSF